MQQTVIQALATAIGARLNCLKSGNGEWCDRWGDRIETIRREALLSGSGFDGGTALYLGTSTSDAIRFGVSFHHMDESGMYDGWSDHTVTATPSFVHQVELTISGRNRNDIKDYIAESMHAALTAPWRGWTADE
jgi:hypothetical protein